MNQHEEEMVKCFCEKDDGCAVEPIFPSILNCDFIRNVFILFEEKIHCEGSVQTDEWKRETWRI